MCTPNAIDTPNVTSFHKYDVGAIAPVFNTNIYDDF